jgi:hypothetical protein
MPNRQNIMKKPIIVGVTCCFAIVLYGLFASYHYTKKIHQIAARCQYECPMHLIDLWGIITSLAKEHDQFPKDLMLITNKVPISQYNALWRLHPLLCPGVDTPFDSKYSDAGYAYVNWSSKGFIHVADVPGDYPLVYDDKLANHFGRGVFVLKVDGNVIWDPGALWINDFINKHVDFELRSPK